MKRGSVIMPPLYQGRGATCNHAKECMTNWHPQRLLSSHLIHGQRDRVIFLGLYASVPCQPDFVVLFLVRCDTAVPQIVQFVI